MNERETCNSIITFTHSRIHGRGSPEIESPWTLSPLQTPSPSLLYHCIASLHCHEGNIYSIVVSKELVFTGCESNRIRAWRQPDGMERGCLKANSGEIRAMFAYGNMLFTTHKDHKILVWNFTVSDSFRFNKVSTLPRRGSFLLYLKRTNTHKHKDCISCIAYYQGYYTPAPTTKQSKLGGFLIKNALTPSLHMQIM
jgi:COMPASS component SWD3